MGEQSILCQKEEGYWTLVLNRPDKLNSFDDEMGSRFLNLLTEASQDTTVRAVLITGEGKGFCAGQDLAEVTSGDFDIGGVVRERYNQIISLIRNMPKPVVCAVNGVAAGAGANLAFACDIVLAAETVSFIQSFSAIGLIPDSGGTYMLPRLVGLQRASALALLGEKLPAREAQEMGLVYKLFPGSELREQATQLTSHLASQPTKGFALTKQALNASFGNSLREQLELEEKLQAEAGNSADFREGVAAFLEKRKPVFQGR